MRRHLLPALFAVFVLGPAVFIWMDRKIPVDQISNIVVNKPKAGETAVLHSSVYRHKSCPVTVEMQIIDGSGTIHVLPDLNFRSPIGPIGMDSYKRMISVPEVASPGDSHLRIGLSWRCNFLQTFWPITDLVRDIPFKIERKEN